MQKLVPLHYYPTLGRLSVHLGNLCHLPETYFLIESSLPPLYCTGTLGRVSILIIIHVKCNLSYSSETWLIKYDFAAMSYSYAYISKQYNSILLSYALALNANLSLTHQTTEMGNIKAVWSFHFNAHLCL